MANYRVTVLFFHPFPNRSVVNRALKRAVEKMPEIQFREMYEIYPQFSIDVDAEQEILAQSDVIVFQHPFYWYNCPSLMKEWIDAVLEKGWAYGDGGNKLEGKHWFQVISTGGTSEAYTREGGNRFFMTELLRPFEQSARLCGMKYLQPFIVHGARSLSQEELEAHVARYRDILVEAMSGRLPPEVKSDQKIEELK